MTPEHFTAFPDITRIFRFTAFCFLLLIVCEFTLGSEPQHESDMAHWAEDPAERSAHLRRLTWSRFKELTPRGGFSSKFIHNIDQDEDGFIWLGTRNGLDRFDGYSIRNYRHDPNSVNSLGSNDIRALAAAANGIVWAGSHAAGLDRFDSANGTAIHFRNRPGDPHNIGDDHVNEIIIDKQGGIWAATKNAGLVHIDDQTLEVTRFHTNAESGLQIPGNDVLTVFADSDGRIWAGTDNGVVYSIHPGAPFESIDLRVGEIAEPVVAHGFRQGSDGTLYVLTADGYMLQLILEGEEGISVSELSWDLPQIVMSGLKYPPVTGPFLIDNLDRLWLNLGGKIYIYDTVVKQSTLFETEYRSAFEDRSGTIWIASDPGLYRLDPDTLVFGDLVEEINLRTGDSIGHTFAILEDTKGVVFLSDPSGVWRYQPGTGEVSHLVAQITDHYNPNDTNALYQDREGQIWAGTHTVGLNRFDPETGQSRNYRLCEPSVQTVLCNRVWAIEGDALGNIWVGSAENLLYFDAESDSFVSVPVSVGSAKSMINTGVRSLEMGSNDTIWIGTESGLLKWRRTTDKWQVFVHDPEQRTGLSSNFILALHEDEAGILWVATQLGAHRLDPENGSIERFNTAIGWPNDDIHAVIEDTYGTIWFSTGGGLVSVHRNSREIKVYDEDDGLPNDEFLTAAAHAGDSGKVYFGGLGSVVYFDPRMLAINNIPPHVAFTELRINNEPVMPDNSDPEAVLSTSINMTQSIALAHQRTSLAIEFAGLHYADPLKNTYAYQLVGWDDDWIYTDSTQRVASYTNLPLGDYTLRVKAANKDGVWNDAGRSLAITILTPVWRTWWAYVLYAAAIVTTLLLFIQLRTLALTSRAKHLEHTVMERTQELRDSEHTVREQADRLQDLLELKDRLFTNISHEFRTPLTLMLGPIENVMKQTEHPEAVLQLQMARRNGKRVLRLVDQLLELSKLSSEEPLSRLPQPLKPIVEGVTEAFRPYAHDKGITLSVMTDEDLWADCDPDAMERLLMNLLSNALKFTPRDGRVNVTLRERENGQGQPGEIELVVFDTGKGITHDQQEAVFERFKRADKLGEAIPGSGIGLALVRELTEAHGGKVTLESEPGKGTVVTVLLPRHRVKPGVEHKSERFSSEALRLEVEALEQPEPMLTDDTGRQVAGKPMVLVIEDSRDMQAYLKYLLSAGYEVELAGDGESGLAFAREHVPDIVLCDVMLPKMDGYQVVHELRSDDATSHIPIVMLTARSDEDSRLEGLREHVDDYLIKPFNDEELLLRITNLLAIRDILKARYSGQLLAGENPQSSLKEPQRRFMESLERVMEKHHGDEELTVAQLADYMAMSVRQLQRKLKALTDQQPTGYLRLYRLGRSQALLLQGRRIGEVAYAVGFASPAHFASCFRAKYGCTPTEYQINRGQTSSA